MNQACNVYLQDTFGSLTAGGGTVGQGYKAVMQPALTYVIQGNVADRYDSTRGNGEGISDEGVCYTLNTVDRPAVLVLNDQGGRDGGI